VTRTAADHDRDLAGRGLGGADHATRDTDHSVGVDVEEAFERVIGEASRE
jgi:hypothetical protein